MNEAYISTQIGFKKDKSFLDMSPQEIREIKGKAEKKMIEEQADLVMSAVAYNGDPESIVTFGEKFWEINSKKICEILSQKNIKSEKGDTLEPNEERPALVEIKFWIEDK